MVNIPYFGEVPGGSDVAGGGGEVLVNDAHGAGV